MYPPKTASTRPDAIAYIMDASGERLTYRELDAQSNQLAQYLRSCQVTAGSTLMIAMENRLEWPVVVAAGMRSGLYVTPVNSHLLPTELSALIAETRPEAIVTSPALAPTVAAAQAYQRQAPKRALLCVGNGAKGFTTFAAAIGDQPTSPIDDESLGARVLYSGGTTGRPKAFRQRLLGVHPGASPARHSELMTRLGIDCDTRLLSPAPNYHAAPFTFQLTTLAAGGCVVCMEKFDSVRALAAIAAYGVTHSQWVPTMLIRLLELRSSGASAPSASHRVAVTSGGPCPVDVKAAIDDWWGPMLHEYYGASEGYGHTYIAPLEARSHPGSVGRPLGATAVRITTADGDELPAGQVGQVWFAASAARAYANTDEANTRGINADKGAADEPSWKTMGDLGLLDEDGFLYLRGRTGYTIVSGGVNIYPDEVEEALLRHPLVRDAAVFGEPDAEFGERVVAVVELLGGDAATTEPDLIKQDLIKHCRNELATYKCPRRFEVVEAMPRLPTGKLNKKELREQYAQKVRPS